MTRRLIDYTPYSSNESECLNYYYAISQYVLRGKELERETERFFYARRKYSSETMIHVNWLYSLGKTVKTSEKIKICFILRNLLILLLKEN